jgi:hypothetical protein
MIIKPMRSYARGTKSGATKDICPRECTKHTFIRHGFVTDFDTVLT